MLSDDRDQADYPMMAESVRLSLDRAMARSQSQSPELMIGVESLFCPDEELAAGQDQLRLDEGRR